MKADLFQYRETRHRPWAEQVEKLWEAVLTGDNTTLVETLHSYKTGRARPVSGWEHEPARS